LPVEGRRGGLPARIDTPYLPAFFGGKRYGRLVGNQNRGGRGLTRHRNLTFFGALIIAELERSPLGRADALFVNADAFFTTQAMQIARLAARYGIPAAYSNRAFAEVGGLMSYGPDQTETCRQVGIYTGQILKGGKPADMPVLQVTKIQLVINLKTATTLGMDVPLGLSAAADELIE
jgi:ABC transporter substrate binding protein